MRSRAYRAVSKRTGRTMPSILCVEQKMPLGSPRWLKLGRLLHPAAAQRFCFTFTMPSTRCDAQKCPCVRARLRHRTGRLHLRIT